jgi:endonuclease/exonuclease/phosphatase family metal-dependent hydrolase
MPNVATMPDPHASQRPAPAVAAMPGLARPLHIATYNIHKGFSQFNRRMMVHDLRERLRSLDPDIVFLQEVQGLHLHHAQRHADWPERPQHEFLAEDVWNGVAYGGNAVYDHGHHGNAILSRFPILASENLDISQNRLERRGLLHCEIDLPGIGLAHCMCVHLGLTARWRRKQIDALTERVDALVPAGAPLLIAGDFNDWQRQSDDYLIRRLGVSEVFGGLTGRPARSYPSALPVLRLDRIYVRGFRVERAEVHFGDPWSRISDHAALSAEVLPLSC